jgi:hypothetical protein
VFEWGASKLSWLGSSSHITKFIVLGGKLNTVTSASKAMKTVRTRYSG